MNLEILQRSENSYEVLDYDGNRLFEGTEAQCEDFVCDYEDDCWDSEDSEFDWATTLVYN